MEVNFKKEDRILVVSPHQDDETIGCGGLLLLYGSQCDVLLLTDGRKGLSNKYNDENKLVEIRNKELDKAMKIAKVNKIHRLEIKNNELNKNVDIVKRFNIKEYDYIFVPNKYETQDDHKIVLSIFKSMKLSQGTKAHIFEYEVWTPLRTPTWFLNISGVISKKEKMLDTYVSQMEDRNYKEYGIALNKYRGMFIKADYAEAYQDSNYSGLKAKVYEVMPNKVKDLIKKVMNHEN